jgi:hypothetical protein
VQQRRPDAAVAVLGQERDVDDANLVVSRVEVEVTGRLPADENGVEAWQSDAIGKPERLGHPGLLSVHGEERELRGSGER